jgi:hypothetical protein
LIFFRKYTVKMVGTGAENFDKLEAEPHKNGPVPQQLSEHCCFFYLDQCIFNFIIILLQIFFDDFC